MTTTTNNISDRNSIWVRLNYLFLILLLAAISFILSSAMFLQYVYHELPCPLCLLQRLAYFGICFGVILNIRNGYSLRHMGFSMLFTIYLLIVSVRQSLLDIIPRPGHEWIGSAIFGLHLPVWSIIFSLLILIAFALKLSIIKHEDFLKFARIDEFPVLRIIAYVLICYLIVLCAINVVSIFLQCGFYICHTFKYIMLENI